MKAALPLALMGALVLSALAANCQSAVMVRDHGAVPLSVVTDVLSIQPTTNTTTGEVTLAGGTVQVSLIPYVPRIRKGTKVEIIQPAPFLLKEILFVPLRPLADAFALTIKWDTAGKQVTLSNQVTGRADTIPITAFDAVENTQALMDAVGAGNLETVRSLVDRDPTIISCEKWGIPLGLAAANGLDAIVQFLLERGAGNVTPGDWPLDNLWDPPADALAAAATAGYTSTVNLLGKRSYYARPGLVDALLHGSDKAQEVVVCRSNQRVIVMAALAYAQDHNDMLPNAASWVKDLSSSFEDLKLAGLSL